jgi:hypothetical protein
MFQLRMAAQAAVLALAACGGGGETSAADAAPSPACQEATSHSDLQWVQENIFTASCAGFSSCHQGSATQAANLNLEAGQAEANLVNRIASSEGLDGLNLTLVVPGDSSSSHLMVIMDHESKGGRLQGPLPSRGTMPLNNPLLCRQKLDALARWIDSL